MCLAKSSAERLDDDVRMLSIDMGWIPVLTKKGESLVDACSLLL